MHAHHGAQIDMSELPPSAIHAYIRHYNLVPLPLPLPQSLPASVPAPINYTQAVFPTPAQSATPFERAGPGGGPPVEAEEGLDVLKTPAWDGQEVGEADQRLQEMAREHWDSVSLKEGALTSLFRDLVGGAASFADQTNRV